MKATQFWILMACSFVIGILLLREISLSRTLYQQERALGDTQEAAASAATYENAWKQLAIRIYETGHQDAALMAVLKSENIGVHEAPNAGSESSSTDAPGQVPSGPAKPLGTISPAQSASGPA